MIWLLTELPLSLELLPLAAECWEAVPGSPMHVSVVC